jgi:hypothetical protein
MKSSKPSTPARRISPEGAQCFFGYYDLPAADRAGRHLCHRVQFRDRLPAANDTAELGWLPLPSYGADPQGAPVFTAFAETRAWNFQQGAMLQWLPEPDTCLYNTFEDGQFRACLHNIRTGQRRQLPRPAANVSQDGTKALSINMARLFAFRPGYGYAPAPDPFAHQAAPEADGVFLLDLADGTSRLVLSLAEAVAFLERSGEKLAGRKVLINHLTFNPSATRYLLLLRTFPSASGGPWSTYLLTASTTGGGLRQHPVGGIASHYHWRDDNGILCWAKISEQAGLQLALISDASDERRIIDRNFFRGDGHCSYSPDRRWILYDSYPDASTPEHLRALQVYALDRRAGFTLGRFRSESLTGETVDLRCDLHPRWMPGGRAISFDSIHEGYRAVYWADLGGVTG